MPLAATIAIAVVAAVVLIVAAAWWLGRLDLRPLRASAAEAGERSSDLAAEFFEWLRRGR
jgi:hypothetical protein